MVWKKIGFLVSDNPVELDVEFIHEFLSGSYWAKGRPLETVRRSIDNSLNFGIYQERQQIGFARVITDRATFAYLCDVFVSENWRGKGAGKFLLECVLSHPELQNVKWMLKTSDAQPLYSRFDFSEIEKSGWMRRGPSAEV